MDWSRELASIHAIGIVIGLYLIFLIGVQAFNVTGLKISPFIQIGTNAEKMLMSCAIRDGLE